jgi:hypothetical protein
MKYVRSSLAWLWWLWVATIPLKLHEAAVEVSAALGCQKGRECYPDSPWDSLLSSLEWLEIKAALILWPVCAWFVIFRPLFGLIDRLPSSSSKAQKDDRADKL